VKGAKTAHATARIGGGPALRR